MIESVLFICTGNICRSPIAQFELARQLPGVYVDSAGISAVVGEGVDPVMEKLASGDGLSTSGHIARQLTREQFYKHDLVLAMHQMHMDWLTENYPEGRGRIRLVSHWSGGYNIPDPYKRSLAVYRLSYSSIRQCCFEWAERLAPAGGRGY